MTEKEHFPITFTVTHVPTIIPFAVIVKEFCKINYIFRNYVVKYI